MCPTGGRIDLFPLSVETASIQLKSLRGRIESSAPPFFIPPPESCPATFFYFDLLLLEI